MSTTHVKSHTEKHTKELHTPTAKVKRLGQGFDQVSEHVIITDKEGYILYANKATETISGYSIKEIIGKKPGHVWGGMMGAEFYKKMWNTIRVEKKPFVGEVQNRRKDGALHWQELHISPILDERGDVEFYIAIEPDITDKKEKEKFKDEFASIVSHQLRNPLQTIGLLTELLLASKTITNVEREEVQTISDENKGLAYLIGDFLVLSQTGNKTPSRELLDIGDEIKNIISEARKKYPRVAITSTKMGHGFPLIANKSLTIQVFSNLVYNALEYSDGKVRVVLEKKGISYIFSCHNNGLEISPEIAPRIFSKLFRADSARYRKESGSGLGLYIVKTITDMSGWSVWFESSAGKGTTFFVKISLK